MQLDESAIAERFPRSSTYDRDWMVANSMGPNALWITEFLSEALRLEPGMRILDLGCGKAMSSIFLAREFGSEVWATDLWIPAADNEERIREAGLTDQIHAVHAEAHDLPFDRGFFDAIVSLDAFHYFGTADLYLGYVARFLETRGRIGIVCPGLVAEFDWDPPAHLQPDWHWEFATFHSAQWWARHWDRIGKFDVLRADLLDEGWKYWAYWDRVCEEALGLAGDASMVERDAGRYLGFVRVIAELRQTGRWRD